MSGVELVWLYFPLNTESAILETSLLRQSITDSQSNKTKYDMHFKHKKNQTQKPSLAKMKIKTTKPRFSRLLWHPDTKWSVLFL